MLQTKLVLPIVALAVISVGCTNNMTTSKSVSVAKETEARDTLNSILFDQQTYYIEHRAFTTSIQDLKTMKTTLESPNYKYSIQAKPNKQKGVSVTATPKRPDLRSFTGVVFALDTGKETLTVSEICETMNPASQAPAAPKAPQRPTDKIQCPVGSNSSLSVVALQ